jgi:hypothetical protein
MVIDQASIPAIKQILKFFNRHRWAEKKSLSQMASFIFKKTQALQGLHPLSDSLDI